MNVLSEFFTTPYKLRDYQKEASERGFEYFLEKKKRSKSNNGVIVAPTGSGKSLVIADIANKLNDKVLIFQPRKELLIQNYEKYISYGNKASIYSSSMNSKEVGNVTFATIGSVVNESEKFKDFKYCIIDECHMLPPDESSMYQRFLSEINAKVLGLTATPFRLKQYNYPDKHSKINMLNRMRPKAFGEIIHVTQIYDLVKKGYFSDTEYVEKEKIDNALLKLNSTKADYTLESMKYALDVKDVNEKVLQFLDNSKRNHVIVFVPSVEEAKYIAQQGGGEYIHAKTPIKKRKEILERFKNGDTPFIANVNILGIGFDFPELDTVVMARPTLSLATYYQWIGRGVRPHPSKDKCLIIDFVGNIEKFGRVEDLEIKPGDYGWGVYSKGNLLTNRDITSDDEEYKETEENVMNFGGYKGKDMSEIPESYMKWIWQTIEEKPHSKKILNYIRNNYNFSKEERLINKK